MKFADQISLTISPEVMTIGPATEAKTIAFMAAVRKIAFNHRPGEIKEGDQIEWEAVLKGRITVDKRMIDAAVEQLLR